MKLPNSDAYFLVPGLRFREFYVCKEFPPFTPFLTPHLTIQTIIPLRLVGFVSFFSNLKQGPVHFWFLKTLLGLYVVSYLIVRLVQLIPGLNKYVM